jgi:hypothetical protein
MVVKVTKDKRRRDIDRKRRKKKKEVRTLQKK